jgi:cytoskeletal protein RodZ
VASLGIGETLRRERERQGISLGDIARKTRIQPRFLEAIEADNLDVLPGLVFARNFVRQYAQALQLDEAQVLERLPKLEEAAIRLPDPPARPRKRTRYTGPRSNFSSWVWVTLALAAGVILYTRFSPIASIRANIAARQNTVAPPIEIAQAPPQADLPAPTNPSNAPQADANSQDSNSPTSSVQVVVTALQEAWVQLSADGKTSFTGTLMPNEKKEISAAEQVKLVAGNAGGLTVSLNGKPLEPLGPVGQVRVVRLTAEGPQFLPTSPLPAPDPL